ncbi:MAG: PaaX family transcriptional regulator [Salaquimonas sp.]|jgi:phenylacetic acid degradation operon negative regulatory protein|nr:PaaX family transcriptional regulator [Salaquimonas sp.]
MAVSQSALHASIEAVLQGNPPRAGAFIVTLYGDVVVPRGGNLWIGNVIDTCARVRISESLVRTSVSRLVANGTLTGERHGKRSFYRLGAEAVREFDDAARRIYGSHLPADAGDWTFAQFPRNCLKPASLERLQKAGFAMAGPELTVAPGIVRALPKLDCAEDGLVFHARLDMGDRPALQHFAAAHWPLDELAEAYRGFVATVKPFLGVAADRDGAESLVVRLLLVHEFRRVVLADPGLPAEALPDDWPGHEARRTFADIYKACSPQADAWVAGQFVDVEGPIHAAGETLTRRAAAVAAATEPA